MAKTIFITGGSTGIGAAAVVKFAAEGWNVAFMDTNADAGMKLVEALGDPANVLFSQGDTRNRDDLRKAIDLALAAYGQLDSVFANAGIHQRNTLLDISQDDLHRIIDINIYGTVNTLQLAVPEIIKAGGGSVVINCSDQWFVGKPHSFAYGLTKGALGQITRSLSVDLGPYGIRVNAICAGTIRTPLVDRLFERFSKIDNKTVDQYWAEENALFARGRAGEPAEVAEMVYFLAGDKSSFCTGGHYLIDGGLVAR